MFKLPQKLFEQLEIIYDIISDIQYLAINKGAAYISKKLLGQLKYLPTAEIQFKGIIPDCRHVRILGKFRIQDLNIPMSLPNHNFQLLLIHWVLIKPHYFQLFILIQKLANRLNITNFIAIKTNLCGILPHFNLQRVGYLLIIKLLVKWLLILSFEWGILDHILNPPHQFGVLHQVLSQILKSEGKRMVNQEHFPLTDWLDRFQSKLHNHTGTPRGLGYPESRSTSLHQISLLLIYSKSTKWPIHLSGQNPYSTAELHGIL